MPLLSASDLDVLSTSTNRRLLDVFSALSLTQGERDAVYEAVIDLVQSRLSKADSLRNTARSRRSP